ncbi:rhomboid family intramembrane serine protease [bacterium]|nr:rhomboid family intramembrane serine protease [bacterium]
MFLIQLVADSGLVFGGVPLNYWIIRYLYLHPLDAGFMPWQLITYMFLHGGFMHIFFNMLLLWMFGMELENIWGSRKFLSMYLAAGITAGLANLFIAPLFTGTGPTIGASGGVYAVLVAFAMIFPDRYVYLYFFFPVRAKYMISFFLLLEVYNGVTGTADGIAHVAHLGGALLGIAWVLLDRKGRLDSFFAKIDARKSAKQRASWDNSPREAKFYDFKESGRKKTEDKKFNESQSAIDEILDKISVSGYGSLTEKEKSILLDASKRIHPDKDAE